jgi:hypothetical protein
MPNDCISTALSELMTYNGFCDSPLSQIWNDKKQTPKQSTDVARERREQEPRHNRYQQDNSGCNTPAAVPRVPQASDTSEQNNWRKNRDEKQDMIEVDQAGYMCEQ